MVIRGLADLISFSPEGAQKVPLAQGRHCRVTAWCLEPGQEIRPHTHAGDHVWVVQEGQGWVLTPVSDHPVAPGDVVFVPEGEAHGMRACERMVFVSVSAG